MELTISRRGFGSIVAGGALVLAGLGQHKTLAQRIKELPPNPPQPWDCVCGKCGCSWVFHPVLKGWCIAYQRCRLPNYIGPYTTPSFVPCDVLLDGEVLWRECRNGCGVTPHLCNGQSL